MTRPKVPDEKRQRTAQACDTCKRRKQKCNGLKPCTTCTKRSLTCTYAASNEHGPEETPGSSPKKRRHLDDGIFDISPTKAESPPLVSQLPPPPTRKPSSQRPLSPIEEGPPPSVKQETRRVNGNGSGSSAVVEFRLPEETSEQENTRKPVSAPDTDARSRVSTASGPDEDADVFASTRMLQDPTGRLLYVGESASLSYLQLIRMIVESVAGPSEFTLDPSRHKIMEATIVFPDNVRPPHILLDRQTANVLVESYFTNTHGLIEIFDRKWFECSLDACYSAPLTVSSSFLCILYLVFAIGLVFATPTPGTQEEAAVKGLKDGSFDRAEAFFRSAKCLGDPVSGFEDADFWSVQALSLMSVYMLAVSKRNAAYAYYGMAVRSAFALGLHRTAECVLIFKPEEQAVRRNLWRSLYVLDRFLAASLGRPTAISEDDCSPDALASPGNSTCEAIDPSLSVGGLDAAVQSCEVIGRILKKVYSKRKISTKLAQEISEDCKSWDAKLPPELNWKRARDPSITPAHGLAILHVNLLYCHSVILFSRPFLLFLLMKDRQETASNNYPSPRYNSRMERFAEACVATSTHSIRLVQTAFDNNYLPQRNPFVLYFLFAASLVVLSNEFAGIYKNPEFETSINNAISIVKYCSLSDPQATRLLYIITTFKDVVDGHHQKLPLEDGRVMAVVAPSPGGTLDPMANIFTPHDQFGQHINPSGRRRLSDVSRRGSLIGAGPVVTMLPPPVVPGKSGENGPGVSPASTGGHSATMSDGIPGRYNDADASDPDVEFESFWLWGQTHPPAQSTAPVAPPTPSVSTVPEGTLYQQDAPQTRRFEAFTGFASRNEPALPPGSAGVPMFTPSRYQ